MKNRVQTIADIFLRFLALGCMSFGGPAAHIGYFRHQFVEKLQWLDDAAYARLIALSQFLPGPGSSQVGFAIGLQRGGLAGGLAAFTGFTVPSLTILLALSITSQDAMPDGVLSQIIHGLKLLAVVVVADATRKMFRSFCTSGLQIVLCGVTACLMLVNASLGMQMAVLLLASLLGGVGVQGSDEPAPAEGKICWAALVLFALLFAGCIWMSQPGTLGYVFAQFYEAGSLVFGGGHVVLPLLQATVGDVIETDRFLFGYAAAQAIPGPMFSVAGFLGAEMLVDRPILSGLVATAAIFIPGFLLLIGLRGGWERLMTMPRIAGAAAGINAAVVGLLFAALINPVFTSAVHSLSELLAVVIGFGVLVRFKPPIVVVVAAFALLGIMMAP